MVRTGTIARAAAKKQLEELSWLASAEVLESRIKKKKKDEIF